MGESEWRAVSEKRVLEKLAECFDPIYPIIGKMLAGDEIFARREIYRIRC